MNRRMCMLLCLVVATLQLIGWVSVTTSRPFASYDGVLEQDQKNPESPKLDAFVSKQELESMGVYGNEETYRGLSRLGSRPPSCGHKCEGCVPCDAIQIPATTDRIGVEYANYEPEGWKCKCGSSFFNP